MKRIEVITEANGLQAKEVNPYGCYGGNRPHPMDFEDKDEFAQRHQQFEDYESKLRMFEIELGVLKGFTPHRKHDAEILENGKIKILVN